MENEDLKGFFKANFRFRCEWEFIRIKEITTTRPENSATINDFQKWKILENSPKISVENMREIQIEVKVTTEKAEEKIKLTTEKGKINSIDEKLDIWQVENISETEIEVQVTTTEKAEEKIKLTTEKRKIKSTDEKWDIWQVENISENQIEVQVTTTEKAEEKIKNNQENISETEKINVTEEPGEKNHATEQVSQLNIVQLTTEKEEIKKNEYDKTTNYVDLPKFKTENNDKEVRIYFIVTIITVAVLLLFIGTMIVLIILCKKKSEKKVTNFPLQSLGGDSE